MKYRFRPSGKKRNLPISENTVLRLKGSNKPKKAKNLPEAREKIDFSETGKKSSPFAALLFIKIAFWRFRSWTVKIAKRIITGLKSFFGKTSSAVRGAWNNVSKDKKDRKKKAVNSLPLLAGAMTASFLVCTFSVICMAFGLFSFYGRSYRNVTVPDTVGSLYSELGYLGEDFAVSVKSVNNPDFPDGAVIGQSPPAGVTRRIYKDRGPCKITLTVNQIKKLYVPDGLLGASERDAVLTLKNAGIPYRITKVHSDSAENSVTSVFPKSGTSLSVGEPVTITVSLGKHVDTLFMPDLLGLSENDASEQLSMLGLRLKNVIYVESSQKAGTVTSQSIIKNTSVPRGTEVSITVSLGRN